MADRDANEPIPIVETYRGVGIHDQQPKERIDGVVKPAIDYVLGLSNAGELTAYCGKLSAPPEARLLAAAVLQAMFSLAAERREARPDIDLDVVRASVVGLGSQQGRSRTHYSRVWERGHAPGERGPDKREVPLPEKDHR